MKEKKKDSKSFYIRVNQEDYDYILQQVEDAKISINSYIKRRLLDSEAGCKERSDSIMRLIPGIYTQIDQIEDTSIRQGLREEVSKICQCLR